MRLFDLREMVYAVSVIGLNSPYILNDLITVDPEIRVSAAARKGTHVPVKTIFLGLTGTISQVLSFG